MSKDLKKRTKRTSKESWKRLNYILSLSLAFDVLSMSKAGASDKQIVSHVNRVIDQLLAKQKKSLLEGLRLEEKKVNNKEFFKMYKKIKEQKGMAGIDMWLILAGYNKAKDDLDKKIGSKNKDFIGSPGEGGSPEFWEKMNKKHSKQDKKIGELK